MVEFRVKTYQQLGPQTVLAEEGRDKFLRLPEWRGMPGSRGVRYSNHKREVKDGRRDLISTDGGKESKGHLHRANDGKSSRLMSEETHRWSALTAT